MVEGNDFERPATRALNVLVVDDTKVITDVLAQIFAALGHQATVANSGHDAVRILEERGHGFDVIFSDLSMPDMDGHELAQRITVMRERDGVRTKMLVAMSGYSDPAERERARQSGFDRHVVKPPELDDLEKLLAEIDGM